MFYLASNCDNGAEELLVGIWFNSDYDASDVTPVKLVLTSDGKTEEYLHVSDTEPYAVGTYSITNSWVDDNGNTWYVWTQSSHAIGTDITWEGYILTKIDNVGTTAEMVWDEDDYPVEINPSNPSYAIYYRQ